MNLHFAKSHLMPQARSVRQMPAALVTLGSALLCIGSSAAFAQSQADDWQLRATVYAWLPSVSGSTILDLGGGSTITTEQILDALDFAFMGQLDVRKGRWGALTDYIYLDFSKDKSFNPLLDLTLETDMRLKGSSWTLVGTYAAIEKPGYQMQLFGGARYLNLDTRIDWQASGNLGVVNPAGSQSVKLDYWDGIIGVRGRADLRNGPWYVPYYLDIGTGDSNITWQAYTGIGYRFGWGDVTAVYRMLDYDFESDSLIRDLDFAGPAIGLSVRW
jgi:hypothetical protein